MAKRRKEKDEQAEEDFKLPKFDEEDFIKKEKQKIRMTFVAFFFGFLIAFVSFGFWVLLSDSPFQWMLVFLFGLFNSNLVLWLLKLYCPIASLGVTHSSTNYILTSYRKKDKISN